MEQSEYGYIRLSRKFFSNYMWKMARTFSTCEAWLDMIQSARFDVGQPARVSVVGREVALKRGQMTVSIRYLARRWRWGERHVRSFLEKLKKDGMIDVETRSGVSVVTLTNYELYNPSDTPKDTPKDTPNAPQTNDLQPEATHQKTHRKTQRTKNAEKATHCRHKEEEYIYSIDDLSDDKSLSSSDKEDPILPPREGGFFNASGFIDFWNTAVKDTPIPRISKMTEARRALLGARIREYGKEQVALGVMKLTASRFCCGDNNRGWIAAFDWFIRPNNFPKVIEGTYDNRPTTTTPRSRPDAIGSKQDANEEYMRLYYARRQERERQMAGSLSDIQPT